MGNDEDTTSGIEKLLKKGPSFIKHKFLCSAINYNYMELGCSKVTIPGKEVQKNSTFYLFNIEGFFDIENGFYFSFLELLRIIIALEKIIGDLKSYDEIESFVKKGIMGAKVLSDLGIEGYEYYLNNKNDKSKSKNKSKEKKKFKPKSNSTKVDIKKKKNNNNKSNFNSYEDMHQSGELIYGITYTLKDLINRIPSKYLDEDKYWSWIRPPLKFLKKLIGFNDLKALLLEIIDIAQDVTQTYFGICGLAIAPEVFATNKFLGVLYGINGAINLIDGGVGLGIKTKNAIDRKRILKRNKHQDNFMALLNLMKNQMQNMKKKNYKDLYDNNVIILSIDLTDDTTNEGVDCKLANIIGIEEYATPLNYYDNNRKKYITNMIEFYSILLPKIKIPELMDKNDKNMDNIDRAMIEKSYYFLLYMKEIIINQYNNKNFWINASEYQIRDLINNNEVKFNTILSAIAANENNEDIIKKIYSKEIETKKDDNDINNNFRKKYTNNYNINKINNESDYYRPVIRKRRDYNKELNESLIQKNYISNKIENQNKKKLNQSYTYYRKENKYNNSKYTFARNQKRSNHNYTEIKDYENNSSRDGDFEAPPTAYFRKK